MSIQPSCAPLLATSDLDVVRHALSRHVSPSMVDLNLSGSTTGEYRLSRVAGSADSAGSRIGLMQWEVEPQLRIRATSTQRYTVAVGFAGQNEVAVDRRQLSSSSFTVTSPGQELDTRHRTTRKWLFFVGQELIDEAVRGRLGDVPNRRLVFDPILHGEDPAAAAWLRTLHSYAEMSQTGVLARSPLGSAHLERALVQSLLDVQPHTFTGTLTRDEALPGLRTLRRAVEFCEANLAHPIVAADIATAAHTSLRTIQRLFRTEFGMTPMEYVRELRLDRVRRDLMRIRMGDTTETVTDVACRWGFVHLGRFSSYYGSRFGERPSETAGFRAPG
ncbi:AraC family transcriptional regulator [Pseudonocardia sp. TRM90224]|uniref:AraC family transcriptional regulator n=1 Tax=Pseudonocardia sp. TRM90224 TaxID=2812678 RepID=UPI001E416F48|nr:helix-turn-helix domain-containing protein [Pseudonocardia sp. TRM90224]